MTDVVRASEVSFNEAMLRVAAAHNRLASFRYAKGDGEVIEARTLKPSAVRTVEDHVTFTGYDPDRDEVRAYRLDRIKGEVGIV
jgi:predicted DNA-binding transcriptional regulator YafY